MTFSLFLSLLVCRRSSLLTGERRDGEGEGTKSSINHSLLSDCTDLGRYFHKTSGFKTSGFNTSETTGLQNVKFTKHHVYKTSGLQNIRLQYARFQNVLTSKYFKTSGFKNVQYYITNYEEIQSKRITKVFW
jgi:hypothetical protein